MNELMGQMMTEDDYLEHFGKKGMKWGVRKGAKSNSSHTSADAARYNKISARSKKNGLDNLSNDDLAKLNKRKQLLTEYKKNNPSVIKKGSEGTKTALKVLKGAGTLAVLGVGIAEASKSPTVKAGIVAVAKVLKTLK